MPPSSWHPTPRKGSPCKTANLRKRHSPRLRYTSLQRPTETPVQRTNEPVLQVRDASFRYERKVPFVLKGCNLTVQKGTLHAIVGGNGCGKSTLLALAARTMRPGTRPHKSAAARKPRIHSARSESAVRVRLRCRRTARLATRMPLWGRGN